MMWKNFSKAELDAAYNNSKAVANSSEIIQAWLSSSADVKRTSCFASDVAYGQESFPAFDFYLANYNAPTIAFVHGGFWQMRSKNDFAFIVPTLLKKNLNVAMLGYRLAPHATIDEIVTDVRDGIDSTVSFLHRHPFLQKSLWLVGWSAGAHLSTMQLNHPSVLGVTAISGIYELEPMRLCYVNDLLQLDEVAVEKNSPMRHQQNSTKVIDIFVGGAELPEMQDQSIRFALHRKQCKTPGEFSTIAGLNHYTILDELTQDNGQILTSLLGRI